MTSRTVHMWGGPMDGQTVTIAGNSPWITAPMPAQLSDYRSDCPPDPSGVMRSVDYAIHKWGDPASRRHWWLGVADGFPLDRISQHINGAVALFIALGWVSPLIVSTAYGEGRKVKAS